MQTCGWCRYVCVEVAGVWRLLLVITGSIMSTVLLYDCASQSEREFYQLCTPLGLKNR
jgi:hypothetical protein